MTAPPDPGFFTDVRSAFRVAVDRPLLPLMSVVVWSLPILLPEPFTFIAVPIWIFSVGYPGTERLWLLRGLRDQPFTLDQVFKRNWSYLGRYLRLGLLLILPFAVVVILVWLAVNRTYVGFFVGLSVIALLADFAVTFVTPALAFSTRRAREALSIGLRMIRSEWPQDALYVLIPPMAILIVAQLVPTVASLHRFRGTMKALNAGRRPPSISESSRLVSASFSALAAMIGLLFKGATAAFYSRRFTVPEYGASSGPEDLPRPPRLDTCGLTRGSAWQSNRFARRLARS